MPSSSARKAAASCNSAGSSLMPQDYQRGDFEPDAQPLDRFQAVQHGIKPCAGAFPVGFILESFQIHINGVEIRRKALQHFFRRIHWKHTGSRVPYRGQSAPYRRHIQRIWSARYRCRQYCGNRLPGGGGDLAGRGFCARMQSSSRGSGISPSSGTSGIGSCSPGLRRKRPLSRDKVKKRLLFYRVNVLRDRSSVNQSVQDSAAFPRQQTPLCRRQSGSDARTSRNALDCPAVARRALPLDLKHIWYCLLVQREMDNLSI